MPSVLSIRPRVISAQTSAQNSPMREKAGFDFPITKPAITRTATFEGPTSLHRDSSPVALPRLSRTPTESTIMSSRSQLRPVKSRDTTSDVFGDENGEAAYGDFDAVSYTHLTLPTKRIV